MRNEGKYQRSDGVSTFATDGLEVDVQVGLVAHGLCFAPRLGSQKQIAGYGDLVPLLIDAFVSRFL